MDVGIADTDSADALARDLRRSITAFVRAVRKDTGTVRTAQSEALDLLDRMGTMTVAALAQKRGTRHQTMRLVVAKLNADELVRQEADPADRRGRLVSISSKGRDTLKRERNMRVSRIEDAIQKELSPSERVHLRAAIPILDRLTKSSD
jgi:DNA-binding MarR family transcriptional regulator